MHSMLFVGTMPTDQMVHSPAWQAWRAFSAYAANRLQQFADVERLAENVWMVNMRADPLPLALLVTGAHDHSIGYRLLPFADEPQWLPAASGSTSTLGLGHP
jgi:hypothetical protein